MQLRARRTRPISPWWRVAVALWVAMMLTLCATPSLAAGEGQGPGDPAELLEQARKELDGLGLKPDLDLDDDTVQALRKQAQAIQVRADEAAATLAPQLADVQARLAELGEPVDGVKESADVAEQRRQLMATVSRLDSQLKLARLLAIEAEQAAANASANRRQRFNAQLEARTPALVGTSFWQEVRDNFGDDLRRLRRMGQDLVDAAQAVPAAAWWACAAWVGLWLLLRWSLQRLLVRLTSTRVPAGRLRRSLYACGVTLVRGLTPTLIAMAVYAALEAGGGMSTRLTEWTSEIVAIVAFGGFVSGLGLALLMPHRPSWRLPPLPDALCLRLQWFPPALGGMLVLAWAGSRLASIAGASLPTTWWLSASTTVLLGGLLALALWVWGRTERALDLAAAEGALAAGAPRPSHAHAVAPHLAASTVRALLWLTLLAMAGALLWGYIALSSFVISQLVWALIVLCALYLLAVLVDDLFMDLLAPTLSSAPVAEGTDRQPPAGPRTRAQLAVVLSGLCRAALAFVALVMLLAPYGEAPTDLVRRANWLTEGWAIGEMRLRPSAIFEAAAVVMVGLFGVRILKHWLTQKVMPTTHLDVGMRASVTTLFGFVGGVVVVAFALSAIGLGLERVAWVASALSVGIGFGLQAVVQNFVSGLILLAERPVKVGDWVALGGVEGDIRRINVRATEIQMGDRSTVIVPNSEFITKVVRNITFSERVGMVQVKLPMPLTTDAARARELLLACLQGHPAILDTPAPSVQLDAVDGQGMVFNVTGYVASPRSVYGVRSELLFQVLERLAEAGIALSSASAVLISHASAPAGAPPAEPPAPPLA